MSRSLAPYWVTAGRGFVHAAAHEAIAVLVLLVVPSRERVVEVDER